MKKPEIIFNLWYLADETGAIYSLKAKMYVHEGSDEEKQEFLQSRALLDYMVAEDFDVPSRFSANLDGKAKVAAYITHVKMMGGEFNLFLEVIDKMEKRLNALCPLKIGDTPVVCITPLHFTDDYKLIPFEKMGKKKL